MKKLLSALVMMGVVLGGLFAAPVYAADTQPSTLCDSITDPALLEAAGCNTFDNDTTLFTVATNLIKVVLGVMGVVAVGVVIYGGFTFTTSTGNVAKTTKARNILLYGVVGLVVSLLAYAIVSFVSGVLA